MIYEKKPTTTDEQIQRLEERGLLINNKERAKQYLRNISYYRLKAYTRPILQSRGGEQRFVKAGISFKDVIDLYSFDSQLRSLLFNAIEQIEVALRTRISLIYSVNKNDGFWFLDPELYPLNLRHTEYVEELRQEIWKDLKQSKEEFIAHYREKYVSPSYPPAWITLEVISMGKLSRLISSFDWSNPSHKQVCREFGLKKAKTLTNWMHALSRLRNFCAHHSRVWNRKYIKIIIPKQTLYPFLTDQEIARHNLKGENNVPDNKLFAYLSIILYLLQIVSPDIPFKQSLQALLQSRPKLVTLKDMGFPQGWSTFTLWKS